MLAGRSAEAAREIKGLIEDSADKVSRGNVLVNESGTTLTKIVEGVQEVVSVIDEITNVSRQQEQVMDQVGVALSTLEETSRQNVALAGTANSRTEQSMVHIDTLRHTIEFFDVNERELSTLRKAS